MKKEPITELVESATTFAIMVNQVADQSIKNIDLSMKLIDTQLEYLQLLRNEKSDILESLDTLAKRLNSEREERERKNPILRLRRLYGDDMSKWP